MIENMNWFDIIALGLILLFGLRGLVNGIIKEIFGILGLIGGLIVAVRFKEKVGNWISANVYDLKNVAGVINGDTTELLVGFLAILFAVWIVCLIIGEIVSKFFKWSGLAFIDKIGGFCFSVAKIFLIFAVLASMAKFTISTNKQIKTFFDESVFYPYFTKVGDWIIDMKDNPEIQKTFKDVKEKIEDSIGIENNISSDLNFGLTDSNISNSDLLDLNKTFESLDQNYTQRSDNAN